MDRDSAIKNLEVKTYGYNDVKKILENLTSINGSKLKPQSLKRGDVIRTYSGLKSRPHVIVKVYSNYIYCLALSTTEDQLNSVKYKSRFFGEGWIGKGLVTVKLGDALENYIAPFDDNKSLKQAIENLRNEVEKI